MDIVRLREKIVEFTKTDWKKYPTYEHALQEWAESLLEEETKGLKTELKTAYRKGMRHMAKALKDYDRKFGAYTDYFEHTVDSVLQKEQVAFEEVIMDIELAQALKEIADAKELIRKMLYEYQRLCLIKKETIAEAEQFLIEPNNRFEVTKKGKEYLSNHKE